MQAVRKGRADGAEDAGGVGKRYVAYEMDGLAEDLRVRQHNARLLS